MSSTKSTIDEAVAKLPSAEEVKKDVAKATAKSFQSLRDFAAGGVGGVFSVLVGQPFDLVKVRLQTAEKGVYTGAMDVVRKVLAKDGAKGFYAGVSAPLVGVTPMFAVSFWGYGVGKQLVETFSKVENGQFSIAQISTAGLFSAVPQTIVTAPMERVKVMLQLQGQKTLAPGEKPKYSGMFDCGRQILKEGGIRSLYRGTLMTFGRDGPGSAAYFATYELVKRRLTPKNADGTPGQLSLPAVMVAGGAAGVAMWIPVFPVDTVKSRLQSAEGNPTISGVIKDLYGKGGVKAFFPGFGPAIVRAVPANAATFLGVELAHSALNAVLG